MQEHVPVELLRAQTLAWPLASEASFTERSEFIEQNSLGSLTEPTHRLSEPLLEWLRTRSHGSSIEELTRQRDLHWFFATESAPATSCKQSITAYALRLADAMLELNGTSVVPRLRPPDMQRELRSEDSAIHHAEIVLRLRMLTMFVPADLLVAARWATNAEVPRSGRITLVSPQLRQVLDQNVAETHLHLGAAAGFSLLWTSLMQRSMLASLAGFRARKSKRSWHNTPFGSAKVFVCRILCAAVLRLLLAQTLRDGSCPHQESDCDCFERVITELADELRRGADGHEQWRTLHALLLDLTGTPQAGLPPLTAARVLRIYHTRLWPAMRSPQRIYKLADLVAADPLSSWLPWATVDTPPELLFTHRALRYALNHKNFALALWQYQRIRCSVYRYLTQEPGTAGLDWFSQHYERISNLDDALGPVLEQAALAVESQDLRLGALEVRVQPRDKANEIIAKLRTLARAGRAFKPEAGMPHPELGQVLHLVKRPEQRLGRQTYLASLPQPPTGLRFWGWFADSRRRVLALKHALKLRPEILLLLRGIDIANAELGVATWVSAPLLSAMRAASHQATRTLDALQPRWKAQPLRLTCHAGETYRSLYEGLRRIGELMECGLLQHGDRIGHAVALGDSPSKYARARAFQSLEERLDDLLWQLDLSCGGVPFPIRHMQKIREQARRLVERLYGENVQLDLLRDARKLRHDSAELARCGYEIGVGASSLRRTGPRTASTGLSSTLSPRQLLQLYVEDSVLAARGASSIEIEFGSDDITAFEVIQAWLRKELAAREITVESNPSSNQLIANMSSLSEHPALRLQPLQPSGLAPIHLSINDDDPLTFATCLADEYSYIYFSMISQGVSSDQALAWLDRRRQDGWRSRFTLTASCDVANLERLSK